MFVKASILNEILFSVAGNDAELKELLSLAQLPSESIADTDVEVDWEVGQHIWNIVEKFSGDVNIGLRVGANTPVNSTGLVGMLAQSSPTVEKAWDEISKFYLLFTDMMTYRAEIKEHSFLIYFEPAMQWQELYPNTARHAVSQASIATLKIFSALCRKKLVPREVRFLFERPEKEEEYTQAFGNSIQYGMKKNSLVFNRNVAQYKIVSYASEVYLSLKDLCVGQLKNKLSKDKSIKSEVGKLIIEGLDKGGYSLHEIATNLGYGERTLQRKLAKEGIKFKSYYNEIRMTLAKNLLEKIKYNVSEIAEQLGYRELSSFRKMFVQTFGQNPKQFQTDHIKLLSLLSDSQDTL